MSSNMSLNFINRYLTQDKLWILVSAILLLIYLSPLLFTNGNFYVPTFDNLDSNVVWYKIIAHSGMIFANNNAIVPNMMGGLPRSSYPGEFDMLLWLYYFFSPVTAYVINELLIHLVAFISMFIFFNRYIVDENSYSINILTYVGSLYFTIIPYWSGAGLSIALLPLVSYSLLNIKNSNSSKYDWLLLIFLPLYTKFIFLYMFYILLAGVYLFYDTYQNKKINKPYLLALTLMGVVFLLSEYRVVYAMFFNHNFISHRTEFNIFFKDDFMDCYRAMHTFFLNGHLSHDSGLQANYVIPVIIIALILHLSTRRFNAKESIFIWGIIALSFSLNIWNTLLTQIYTIPTIIFLAIVIFILRKEARTSVLLIFLQIILATLAILDQYHGLKIIADTIPFFKTLNTTRVAFVQPFIWSVLIVLSFQYIIKKLYYTHIFIVLFIILQFTLSYERSFYQTKPLQGYASFQHYYATDLFQKVKQKIPENINDIRVVSYGIEPAVTLFNGFHTVDGYSANYPLSYKRKFRKVIAKYLDLNNSTSKAAIKVYDDWGSKVYILETTATLKNYSKDIVVKRALFNTEALCQINTKYMIASKKFENPEKKQLLFEGYFKGKKDSWDIYLYKLKCQ